MAKKICFVSAFSFEKGLKKQRWHPDLNWGMEALQASALPLGYATEEIKCIEPLPSSQEKILAREFFARLGLSFERSLRSSIVAKKEVPGQRMLFLYVIPKQAEELGFCRCRTC